MSRHSQIAIAELAEIFAVLMGRAGGSSPSSRSAAVVNCNAALVDARGAERHHVHYDASAEHRRSGEVAIVIANISNTGFMATGAGGLGRGERVVVRLPVIGRIEAHVVWSSHERSGFHFERIVRPDDFVAVVAAMRARLARAVVAGD